MSFAISQSYFCVWSQVNLTLVPLQSVCLLQATPCPQPPSSSLFQESPPPSSRHVIGGSRVLYSSRCFLCLLCWPCSGWCQQTQPLVAAASSSLCDGPPGWLVVSGSIFLAVFQPGLPHSVYSLRGTLSLSSPSPRLQARHVLVGLDQRAEVLWGNPWAHGCALPHCNPPSWWWPMEDLPARHPRPRVLFPVRTGSFCSVINGDWLRLVLDE